MEIIGIYKITSPTSKVYIGQSWNIKSRWSQHRREKRLQCGINRSILKYGYDAHACEVIHELPKDVDQSIIDTYEDLYISLYKEAGLTLLNQKGGGAHGRMSDASKQKMGLKAKGRKPWNLGQKGVTVVSESVRQIISKTHKGKKRSNLTKLKMSKAATGRTHSDEVKRKMSAAKKGKTSPRKGMKHSENTKEKLRLISIGSKHTEETKLKISVNHSRHNLGKPASEESKNKNKIAHLGKRASVETRIKMSQSAKGKPKSKEHNHKVSEALKLFHFKRKQLP